MPVTGRKSTYLSCSNFLDHFSNKRFDVSVIEEKSGIEAIRKSGMDDIIYDKEHPLTELKVWMLFQKSPCGEVLANKINTAFMEMKKDGSWTSIMKPDS